jgi:hypothetical protein
MTVFFGIDVAKEKLDCAVVVHDRQHPIGQRAFPNTPDGIERAAAWVTRISKVELSEVHAVLEPTAAYPMATKAIKREGTLWRFTKLRQVKFMNNIVEQDHRRIKRLVHPGLGFKSFQTASQTVAGYDVMAMIRKGQVASVPANDRKAQSDFIAALFSATA